MVAYHAVVLRGSSRFLAPAFTERNIQKANAYLAPTFLSRACNYNGEHPDSFSS